MASPKTITINGRTYDALTGLPVNTPSPNTTPKVASASKVAPASAVKKPAAPTAPRGQTAATAVHGSIQRSKTLARRAAKKPAPAAKKPAPAPRAHGRHMDIAQSPRIRKFAPNPVIKPAAPKKNTAATSTDKPAVPHPAAQKALAKVHARKLEKQKAAQPQTAKQVKEAAIEKALATPKTKTKKDDSRTKWKKRFLTVAVILVVILGTLFLIYRFIPSVSVGIAASQAGISARYPDFVPDGFSFSQPVSYSDGEVSLTFKSNSNDTSYVITQKRSSWDPSAVLDNVVQPQVGDNYTATKERGLTVYTYSKGAAWTNAGILYTITGDAALSSDQIRHIATSL